MNFRFATPLEVRRANNMESPVHEAVSPEHGWTATMYDPLIGSEAWWFVQDHDGGCRTCWVVGYTDKEPWPGDEAATSAMMAWYWTQNPRKQGA